MEDPKKVIDKSYAWFVLLVAVLHNIIEASVFMSPTIYMVEWDNTFDLSKAQLGMLGSLQNGLTAFTGVFVSPLIAKYGCRAIGFAGALTTSLGYLLSAFVPTASLLYLTYGVIAGIGDGFLYLPASISVQYYFQKKRPFAVGISTTGVSLGILLAPPIIQYFINRYGWRLTIALHAGVVLHVLVLDSFFRPLDMRALEIFDKKEADDQYVLSADDRDIINSKTAVFNSSKNVSNESNAQFRLIAKTDGTNEDKYEHYHSTEETHMLANLSVVKYIRNMWNFALLKNNVLRLYIFNLSVAEYAINTMYKFTPLRATHDGIIAQDAAFLLSFAGMVSTAMRIIGSVIANLPCVNRFVFCGVAVLALSVVITLSSLASSFLSYAIFAAVFGFFLGCKVSVIYTLQSDIVGVTNVAHSNAFIAFFWGVALLTSLPLAGLMVDMTGNFDIPFYVFGGLMLIPGCIYLFMPYMMKQIHHTELEGSSSATAV